MSGLERKLDLVKIAQLVADGKVELAIARPAPTRARRQSKWPTPAYVERRRLKALRKTDVTVS